MKILHFISSLEDGGAEAILYRLCINDPDNSYYVISMHDEGKYGPLLKESGIPVSCLYWGKHSLNIRAFWKFYKLVREFEPDIIQAWMYHASFIGGIIGRLAGCQKIFWGIHNAKLVREGTKKRTFLIQYLCALTSHFIPTSVVYVSTRAMNIHHDICFNKKKSIIISNGIDTKLFSPSLIEREQIRKELNIAPRDFLIGLVARYDPFKDFRTFFCSIKKNENAGYNFSYVLVGKGNTNENWDLINLMTTYRLKSKIILLGPRNDVPAIMNALDIHVTSSKSESFGNVIAEAMSCETLCVSTDVGAAVKIIGEHGWISPPESPDLLSKKMCIAYETSRDKDTWENMKHLSRDRILKNFSIEKMVKKYTKFWKTYLE